MILHITIQYNTVRRSTILWDCCINCHTVYSTVAVHHCESDLIFSITVQYLFSACNPICSAIQCNDRRAGAKNPSLSCLGTAKHSVGPQSNITPQNRVDIIQCLQYITIQWFSAGTVQGFLLVRTIYFNHWCHLVLRVLIFLVQYDTIQYNTVQYSTVQYSTVQCSTALYCTVQYNAVI